MRLSTRSRYATRLLLELARQFGQGPVQVGDISKRQDIPIKYLEQLLQDLRRAGMTLSVRGPRGGHLLAREPESVTLGQVVRLMESKFLRVECVNDPKLCNRSDSCALRLAWWRASQAMFEKLDSVSIADLLRAGQETSGDQGPCNFGLDRLARRDEAESHA